MEASQIRLSLQDELRLAEEQTPGHKATRGPGDTILLTYDPELMEIHRRQRHLVQRAEVMGILEDSVA